MSRIALLLFSVSAAYAFQSAPPPAVSTAAELARLIRETALDPAECYRVRDLTFFKDDIKLHLNEGYLIFSKPVLGAPLAALFTTDVEGGDGEVIVVPPNRSERQSLASFTPSPTLDEHLRAVLMVLTDGSMARLRQNLEEGAAKKAPEMGVVLAPQWSPVAANIMGPMQMRLVADLWSPRTAESGMAFFAMSGKTLGKFDILSDGRASHRIIVRQQVDRDGRDAFNVWTDFFPRQAVRAQMEAVPAQRELEFAVSHYRIEAEIGNDLAVKAVTRLTMRTGREPVRVFPFEIARAMQVSAVRIDGAPAELMRDESPGSRIGGGGEEVTFLVVAPAALAASSEHEIEFQHDGEVIESRGDGVYFVSARGSWYPHVLGQFASYDLAFRYPKRLTLVAAGDPVEDRADGEWRITRRTVTTPVGAAGFNLGVYEKVTGMAAGVSFDVYGNRNLEESLRPLVPLSSPELSLGPPSPARGHIPSMVGALPPLPEPPDPLARLRIVARDVAASLEFFTGLFGPPVLKTLTVAPIPGTFGQGFPGLVYLSTFAYIDPVSRPTALRNARERLFFSDLMVPHEVAHQWWGSIVVPRRPEDEWLLEALANYSSLLWLEKKKGPKEMEAVLESYRTELLSKAPDGGSVESAGPIVWGRRLQGWPNSSSWLVITYGKGTWILHMLRRRMGDEAFFRLLVELRRRYEFKSVTTAGFQALARELRPKGMAVEVIDTFFDSWVYSTGIPSLKLRYSVRGLAPAIKLKGTVEQSGAGDDFSVDTPVELQFPKGPPQTVWVRTVGDARDFSATLRQLPLRVNIREDMLMKK